MSALITAKLVSIIFIVLGLSFFFQPQIWRKYTEYVLENPYKFQFTYLFILIFGTTIVLLHNIWVWDWPVIITIYGWFVAIKGAISLLYPQIGQKFQGLVNKKLFNVARIGGLIYALLGAMLAYQLF
ncbi:hypothetical protein HOC37_07510 [bacterium]|jgi:uncharacterized protein YjeT (DUF2065 family)|nr:hypothetical protein [bacterium]MBT4552804.1 hypothetical protein [bacterium]MBT5989112.1 hypothetical protein [bacterium]